MNADSTKPVKFRADRIKVIACRVFRPEIDAIRDKFGLLSDRLSIDWLPLRAHDRPDELRREIQSLVDAADDWDAVILAYGLCGNSTLGIQAGSIPLFIPRAHDCSQILLGGSDEHRKRFGENPSRGWTSRGYLEEGGDPFRAGDMANAWDLDALIKEYGEENGRFVWESLRGSDSEADPILYYLDVPETSSDEVTKLAESQAAERGKRLESIPATVDFLARLIAGSDSEDILRIEPGESIQASWDENVVVSSGPAS